MRITAEAKAATHERILEAARRLFAAEGFEAATTRDIARKAGIAVGTLFNYFPSKESIALGLVTEAHAAALRSVEAAATRPADEPLSLEEDLFALVAAVLRKLKPLRKYLVVVLDTSLSPVSCGPAKGAAALRAAHLEAVGQIVTRHGQADALTSVALQLYWTLFLGVLGFWSRDTSPRQEDTLALLDQSLAMFAGWLTGQSNPSLTHKAHR